MVENILPLLLILLLLLLVDEYVEDDASDKLTIMANHKDIVPVVKIQKVMMDG